MGNWWKTTSVFMFAELNLYQWMDAKGSPMEPSAFHQRWKLFRAKPAVTRHSASIWQSRAKNLVRRISCEEPPQCSHLLWTRCIADLYCCGILRLPTRNINYDNMQHGYVSMSIMYVNMQHNYVDMQLIKFMSTYEKHVNMRLKITLHVHMNKVHVNKIMLRFDKLSCV